MTRRHGTTNSTPTSTHERHARLQRLLETHRHHIRTSVMDGLRSVRDDSPQRAPGTGDEVDSADGDAQDDLSLALLELRSETLTRIDEALSRLAEGTYGRCRECGEDIAEARLHALPFAVRCRSCEEARESALRRGSPREWRGWTTDRLIGA